METIEAIQTRRSIRRYQDKAVSEAAIEKIVRAAMQAPSAGNGQPWHFVVIDDRKILDKIAAVHPYAQMLKEAKMAIIVCGDTSLEKYEGYWVQDCSAATENLLLAAHDLGLGAVWCGLFPRMERVAEIRKLLELPSSVMPLSLIPIGYPAEKKEREDRFKKERIHKNKWG